MKKCGFLYYLCHIRTSKMKLKINAQPEGTKKKPSVKLFADGKLWGPTFLQLTVDSLLTVSS